LVLTSLRLVVINLDFFPIAAPVGSFAAWAYLPKLPIGLLRTRPVFSTAPDLTFDFGVLSFFGMIFSF
jgi:hypothetical protein